METVWTKSPSAIARSLADAVAPMIASFENRKRVRRDVDRSRYEATLAIFVDRIANVAMKGRSWSAQPFSNDVLKRPGGPGKCLVSIRDGLKAANLIEVEPGFKDRASGRGRVTRVRATFKLRGLAREHGYSVFPPSPTTVLNGDSHRMPDHVWQQDAVVGAFNEFAGLFRLRSCEGYSPPDVFLVRKFKGDWESGGRLYGGFWQDLSKSERSNLTIDGEAVIEIDFRTMQPRILFGLRGLPLTFDPYLVPGFDVSRETGKLVYNRLVNRGGKSQRICPINFTTEFQDAFNSRACFRRFVHLMEEQLSVVSDCFGKEPWRSLQREESELFLDIIKKCLDSGIAAYPVHDSLIVKVSDSIKATQIMLSAFRSRYGVDAEVS